MRRTIKLSFADGEAWDYGTSEVKDLGFLKAATKGYAKNQETPEGGRTGEDCRAAIPGTKEAFDKVLELLNKHPKRVSAIENDMLYSVIKLVDFLKISEAKRRIFFRGLARKSLLSDNAEKFYMECRDTSKEKQHLNAPVSTYLDVFHGMLSVLNVQMQVNEDTMGLYHVETPESNWKSISAAARIQKAQVSPSSIRVLRRKLGKKLWNILGWFFRHIGIQSLDVSGCKLCSRDVFGITGLALEELHIRNCELDERGLVAFWDEASIVRKMTERAGGAKNHPESEEASEELWQEVEDLSLAESTDTRQSSKAFRCYNTIFDGRLRKLSVSHNKLGMPDMTAIASIGLSDLDISYCNLSVGSFAPFGSRNSILNGTLQILNAAHNKLSVSDMQAISRIKNLSDLDVSFCHLVPGSLVPLADEHADTRERLLTLNVSHNKLGAADLIAVSDIGLVSFTMRFCGIDEETFAHFAPEGSALSERLLYLNASYNKIGTSGAAEMSKMSLEELVLNSCSLPIGSLMPFGSQGSILNGTLRKLNASHNELGMSDMISISKLGNLVELDVSFCSLIPGNIKPLGDEESLLRESLCFLNVSHNKVGAEDIASLANINLVYLIMRFCNIDDDEKPLAPFGQRGSAVNRSLKRLEIPRNKLGMEAVAAVSTMRLQELDISFCHLLAGSLAPLKGPESTLKTTLQRLNISFNNKLDTSDMAAVACLGLAELTMRMHNHLQEGTLIPFTKSKTTLKRRLRVLDVNLDKFSAIDRDVIAQLGVIIGSRREHSTH